MPIVGYWAARVRFGTAFVQAWLPGDDVARTNYGTFLDQFGDDQVIFLTWPGCTLDDRRLTLLSDHLRQLQTSDPALGIVDIQDSRSMLARLVDDRNEVTPQAAEEMLRGIAIGSDGTCFIVLRVADATSNDRSRLIDGLRKAAEQEIGIGPSELILAGEPFQVYIIDQASRETIQYYVAPSSLLALGLAWLCLRSWRLTCIVFVLAGIGQLIGLALISFFLEEMSAVLVVLPTLVFMLTLSAAIHLTNYYRDCGGERNQLAGAEALSCGMRPCVLATLTTVVGFASLSVSHLKPVWHFGCLASLGLLLTTAMLLAVFPAAIKLGVVRHLKVHSSTPPSAPTRFTNWLSRTTGRHANLISLLGCVALVASAAGVVRLKTSTEFEDMFPESSPAVKSLRWMQSHLGPINSLEFVVSFAKPDAIEASSLHTDVLAQVQLLAEIHNALADSEHVSSVMSAITFLPPVPSGSGTRNTIRRSVLRRTITEHQSDLEAHQLLANTPAARAWRISARIRDLAGDNYRLVQKKLSAVVQAQIEAQLAANATLNTVSSPHPTFQQSAAPPVTFVITGLRAVIEKAHFALLSDLGGSFATAFLLIAPVMMLIVRGVRSGLLLMIPNLLPVVLVFGCMGWLQVKLDVASILTASVALGIAVDDTLHFVTWFLRGRDTGLSSAAAAQQAIENCARPMLHTTVICTGSMLPFFFSDFLPTSKFALLMILILSGAIAGDLILLPALLQSSVGKWIGQRR